MGQGGGGYFKQLALMFGGLSQEESERDDFCGVIPLHFPLVWVLIM